MAQRYGDSLTGFGSSADPTLYSSQLSNQGDIPLEAQRFLEHTLAGGSHPTPNEIILYANHTNLTVGTVRTWFSRQHASNVGVGNSYHISDHSDPTSPSLLPSSGFLSPQSDLLVGNSSWINDKPEPSADSTYFSNASTDHGSIAHEHDLPDYYATQFPLHITTEPSLDAFPGEAQQEALPAVGWDPRSIGPQNFFDPTYSLTIDEPSSYPAFKHDEAPYSVGDRSTAASLVSQFKPFAVSSEAIGSPHARSKRTSTSIKSHGEDASCEQCGAKFTGRYARGNCTRHSRVLHPEKLAPPGSDRVCRTCHKQFKRQDARRKHEWRKHGIEDAKPHSRRQAAGTEYERSLAGPHETDGDQETLSRTTVLQEEPPVELRFYVPAQAHRAHHHFAEAEETLAGNAYNDYCRMVMFHWERIVEGLRFEQPILHVVFARQLQDLCMQLLHEQYKSLGFHSFAENALADTQSDAGQEYDEEEGGRQNMGKTPVGRRASKESARSHPYSGRPSKKSAADPLAVAMAQFDMPATCDFDCPIHKWHLMYGRAPPCNGCGKEHMNGVRQHLLPTYSQQHQVQLPFIKRCDNCKEDIVDERVWTQGGHRARNQRQAAGACRARSQPQGNSVIVWARLFLKIYPGETRIPSPYRNDGNFLPANLVALLREDLRLQQIMPTNHPQAPLAPPAALNGPVAPQQTGAQLEQDAATDTLVARAAELLAHFLAQEFAEGTHEQVNLEGITVFYRERLDGLRRNAWVQLTQQHQPDPQPAVNQDQSAPFTPTALEQAQGLAFGGANDWTTPPFHDFDQFIDRVQVSNTEFDTQPSNHEHLGGDALFSFTSFTGSSQTSHDCGMLTSMDHSQQTGLRFHDPDDNTVCPPTSHNHGQYLSPHDVYLMDQPGSSRLPQQIAYQNVDAQFMFEVDLTMTSPSQSDYTVSRAPMEIEEDGGNADDAAVFDID